MNPDIKGIISDMDGVILDTEKLYFYLTSSGECQDGGQNTCFIQGTNSGRRKSCGADGTQRYLCRYV